jgi:hypothetical protein
MLRTILPIVALAVPILALGATGADAESRMANAAIEETAVCLDAAGAKSPPVCPTPAGRLQPAESSCGCPSGVLIRAPLCMVGVKPPAESAALKAARRTASADGTLVGDTFEGRAMCETARLAR